MTDLLKLERLYHLKRVYRSSSNGNRTETSAEHSWSCMILADYFLNKISQKLDRQKVMDLLLYHDIVEIEAGDYPIRPNLPQRKPENKEAKAALKLKSELPNFISEKFYNLFQEFEDIKTPEAKFAKAIDRLDPMIQGIHKKVWSGWTRKYLEEKFGPYMKPFPEIEKEFIELLDYLEKEDYFKY